MSDGADLPTFSNYVDGRFVPARENGWFETVDPFTREPWARVADSTPADVESAVQVAHRAMTTWSSIGGRARARVLRRIAEHLDTAAEHLAACESRDNGRPLADAIGQIRATASWYEYFAGLADKIEGQAIPLADSSTLVYTRREPVGVVGAIVPWNSPLLVLAFKVAPALAAGCAVIVKPSEFAPVSCVEFARVVLEPAGVPPGVVNIVTAEGHEPSEALVAHPDVARVSFTGSTRVGGLVGAATLERVGRVSLELGGKSPQLVFADADLERAAAGVVLGICSGSGQSCIAGSRLIVQRWIRDELVDRVTRSLSAIRLGDPRDPATQMGPLANQPQHAKVLGMIEGAKAAGATLLCGGAATDLGGYFVRPTLIDAVEPHMEVFQEEVFGPVITVTCFDSEDEAIRLANSTAYGLGAGVWTENVDRAHRVAAALRSGSVWVNTYRRLSPEVPFGGVGASGVGRESGMQAVLDYTEIKSVWVEVQQQR